MPDIFTVNSGDAIAIQQHYEQVIEALLRAIIDAKQDNNERQGLQIFDGDRLVYGRDTNQFRDEVSSLSGQLLNPQLITELQQLRSTRVGEIVEGAINKRVELDGQVVLQSNNQCRVIINTLLPQSSIQTASSENLSNLDNRDNSNQIDDSESSSPDTIQEPKVSADTNLLTTPGSTRVRQSLELLESSPLKILLSAELEQLQAEIKALQQQHNLYQQLIDKRLQQPQNTSWWQQTINNVSIVVSSVNSAIKMGIQEFKEKSMQHQWAASLKNLFHLQTQPGESHYQTGEYQISRHGTLYEVKELATDKQIMQFRSTPLAVKVEKENLEPTHIKDIDILQRSLQRNEPIPTSFAPVGKQEAEYFARVERVTNALVQYAVLQQRDVEIDGRFTYKWHASPDGKVRIDAKDERGTLLEKSGGKLKSTMNERDLIYFEQILPKLQPIRQQQNISTSQSQKAVSNGLER
ncbi:hypothetical protein NIES37_39670 [Tolypothrix tenuis PCC 7101]|uniref:Uncharacterized protein n=1 Tax=Tolypothrix tenuis PCC 7101 TaxID=231146 RepID=A0A1Z4N2S5_9CYAN|nr:hypothetical protein [Aulosira sp. FACHB-113]BAY99984.1 hypothetical protein NIES37_39670 [Tolypothrix tenuis PCC 7101]BAZ76094.1 hypothetical protein NIES50_46920 [Aulosira laxa NIES-50]